MQQVPQVIGQIGIDALDEGIPGEIAILPQVDFTQQEIADGIRSKFLNQPDADLKNMLAEASESPPEVLENY